MRGGLAGDFFTLLSVTPSTPDREIKSRFRRLAAKYHPDKLHTYDNDGGTTHGGTAQDAHFLLLKTAQDTLLNPSLRYAYNRFGPSITLLSSPESPTIRSYVLAGIRYHLLPSYLTTIVSLTALNYFILPKWGSYWRYLIPSSIVMIELYFLTHSDRELSSLIPPYIPITHLYTLLQTRTKFNYILPPHLLNFPPRVLSSFCLCTVISPVKSWRKMMRFLVQTSTFRLILGMNQRVENPVRMLPCFKGTEQAVANASTSSVLLRGILQQLVQ